MDELLSSFDPRLRSFERIWNTYVRVKLPWRGTLGAPYWERQVEGDPHGFDKFIELQKSSHVLLDEVVQRVSGLEAPILDLGCNVGRHLNALHKLGYTNLYGVDVQREAFENMERVFPEVKKAAHLERGTFQDYLPKVADRFFEVVFTHGATLELIPPSFPICRHVARAASRAVVLAITENGHAYPRLWETEFLRENFLLVKLLRPAHPSVGVSLLAFQRMSK
ncbi:MAG: methyltransferase domain-containing protein [Nitrospirae bacterium]|nr:MAG: methyltransferase domain-containing protein [Nitrospirota bacterium]